MPGPKAKIRDIFRIFASMAHGATFSELCVRFNPAALNINERQLVLFGLLEGLIRRVDKYPITVQRNVFYDHEPIRSPIPASTNVGTQSNNSGSQPLPRDRRDGKSHRTTDNETTANNKKASSSERVQNSTQQNYYYYNGLKSFDEICTKRGISCQQLDSQLSKDRHVIVLLR